MTANGDGREPSPLELTRADLESHPHAILARLRASRPVARVPALGGWLVTRRDLALQVVRNPGTFTVQDPRFSTGRVVGPSMLTLDGEAHARHRAPFAGPFRLAAVRERFSGVVAAEVERRLAALVPAGTADMSAAYAAPIAAAVVTHALGLGDTDTAAVIGWYRAIVAATTGVAAGEPVSAEGRGAVAALRAAVEPAFARAPGTSLLAAAAAGTGLSRDEVASNAAVVLFGGIETTEGMIANALWHLLSHPDQLEAVRRDPLLVAGAVEESLRLEPAAAMVDRYATRDIALGGAAIAAGDLVSVSVSAANRDPAAFADPDRFDVRRDNARRHVAFAAGPHVCIGMHLARLEARVAVGRALDRLPGLRLDPGQPVAPRGLLFRKPPALRVVWDA